MMIKTFQIASCVPNCAKKLRRGLAQMTKWRRVCIYHVNEVPRCARKNPHYLIISVASGKNRPSTAPIGSREPSTAPISIIPSLIHSLWFVLISSLVIIHGNLHLLWFKCNVLDFGDAWQNIFVEFLLNNVDRKLAISSWSVENLYWRYRLGAVEDRIFCNGRFKSSSVFK